MAKSKHAKPYPKEFHRQMVELHRAGRTLSELSREFGCSRGAISRWVKQADRDAGCGDGGLSLRSARSSRSCAGETSG